MKTTDETKKESIPKERERKRTKKHTLMIVPSFAAAGLGSIPAPGLCGTSAPSW